MTDHADGATFSVRVQPGAKKSAVGGERDGSLKVGVTAPPTDGRANAAVVELLRHWLGVKRSQVEIISGATNRTKVVLVRGVTADELTELLGQDRG